MQDVGGAELPYLYYEGEAPQILFAHATGFLPWLWHPIIEDIVSPNQTWVPYICNYRECDPEKGGLAWDIIAEDLSGFCRSQNIQQSFSCRAFNGGYSAHHCRRCFWHEAARHDSD